MSEPHDQADRILGWAAEATGFQRPAYYPDWGDEKHVQATRSASRRVFGEDLTEQILNETRHRQQRTGSPDRGPQPYPDAEAKVWRDLARREEAAPGEVQALEQLVKARCRRRGPAGG